MSKREPSLFTLTGLSVEFGIHTETIKSRINGVPPDGVERNKDAWHIKSVYKLLAIDSGCATSDDDPRKALYSWQAKNEELKYLKQLGELAEVQQVEQELAAIYKRLQNWLDTLPDTMEKEGYPKDKLNLLIEQIDRARVKFVDVQV